jgi:hypothetical protein
MKSPQLRWVLWAGALAAIGAFALIDQAPEDDTVVESIIPAERPVRVAIRTDAAPNDSGVQWHYLASRTQTSSTEVDLFKPWQSTPAKSIASSYSRPSAAVSEPRAPQAPFQYLGRLDIEAGKALVFLTDGKRVYSLTPGQAINNTWRLDRDEPQALHLTYLPMDAPQIISKSSRALANEKSQGVSG